MKISNQIYYTLICALTLGALSQSHNAHASITGKISATVLGSAALMLAKTSYEEWAYGKNVDINQLPIVREQHFKDALKSISLALAVGYAAYWCSQR